jgi:hypothetical protein
MDTGSSNSLPGMSPKAKILLAFVSALAVIWGGPVLAGVIVFPRELRAVPSPDGQAVAGVAVQPTSFERCTPLVLVPLLLGETVDIVVFVRQKDAALFRYSAVLEGVDMAADAAETSIQWASSTKATFETERGTKVVIEWR